MESTFHTRMIKVLAAGAIAFIAAVLLHVRDPSDVLFGIGYDYPELWMKTGLVGAPGRAAACIVTGVLLLAAGWIYRLLFTPLELLRSPDDVGYLTENGRSRARAANEARRRRKPGDLPPVYPNGWYRVLDSYMLEREEVKSMTVLGEQVAVFRGQDGTAYVVDAYCPHLGANLAVGGRVVGNCIECPFHGWQFRGEDGRCVRIPYAEKDLIVHRLTFSPVIDGDFLPDEPSALFSNTADIDYLVGVNNMDGHLFATLDVPSINNPLVQTPVTDVKDLLTTLTSEKGPEAYAAAFEEYTANWGDAPKDSTIKKTIVEIETDYIFLVPAQTTLYLHYEHANTARTYSYFFTEPNRLPLFPSWMGADHADDLQYVFGKPFSSPLGYLPKHRRVSDYMISYWTNFARTGDPNKGASKVPVAWPLFTGESHQYIDINNDMNKNSIKQRLRTRYVYFWGSTYVNFPNIK